MASPVSGLSLENNLITNLVTRKEVNSAVIASDFGYNKVQTLMDFANKGVVKKVNNVRVEVPRVGNTGISNSVNGSPVIAGSFLTVPLVSADTRFRLKDIVKDKNNVQGRVVNTTSTSLTLELFNTASWTANHFVAGSSVVSSWDVSGTNDSYGKSSLSVSPSYDYAILSKMRDTYKQNITDRIKTEVMYAGKYWYASQQMYLMQRYSRMNEMRLCLSDRIETIASTIEGDVSSTGGVRWAAQNGGTYMPLTANPTEQNIQDFIKEMTVKSAAAKHRIMFLAGKEAIFAIQNFLKDNVVHSGDTNTFGGKSVEGYDIRKYAIGGTTIEITEYPLFNDAILFPDLSTYTGKPKMQSTIMAIDWSPAESGNGTAPIPVIQKYCYDGPEVYYKFIPGMLPQLNDLGKEIFETGGLGLATSDSDSSSIQMMELSGYYIIPEKVGWMELIA